MRKSRKNTLPRKSSTRGTEVRVEFRIAGYERIPANIKPGFRRPGSRNPRKVGRG